MRLGDKVLGVQKSERDLGVIVQNDLKVDKQCSKAANEVNKRLIDRNFKCKARKVILPLYKSPNQIIIIIIIIIWFGDTVSVSHPTKCNTNPSRSDD